MLIIEDKHNETEYEIKTSFEEITVGEFSEATDIFNSKLNSTRKYIEIMGVFGLPEDIKKRMGSTTLMKFVSELKKPQDKKDIKDEYELKNYSYSVSLKGKKKKKTLDLTALQQADIEDIFLEGKDVIVEILKVLLECKDDNPTDTKIDEDIKSMKINEGINFIYEVEQIIQNGMDILGDGSNVK